MADLAEIMSDAEKVAEIGSHVLAAAFALYPDIAALVKGAPSASLTESTRAAVERIDPARSPDIETAKRQIEAMGG